jgi:hypothetical protein
MPRWLERDQQGFHQEVYDELLALQAQVFEEPNYSEALLVARAMMSRVRANLELLIPRLKHLGYLFLQNLWDDYWEALSAPEHQAILDDTTYRIIYCAPPADTAETLGTLEHLVGTLPLSIRCWYEEVGSVNLIGAFPATKTLQPFSYGLDPLFIYPIDYVLKEAFFEARQAEEAKPDAEGKRTLALAPDGCLKYDRSGGVYSITVPCRAFDAPLEGLAQASWTFVNYLRVCLHWGGLFGVAHRGERRPLTRPVTREELDFLTRDVRPF